jgi:hypothetical protein
MKGTCYSCRYWDQYTDEHLLDSQRRTGDCRRRPPLLNEVILARVMPSPRYNSGVELDDAMEPTTLYAASAFPVTHETSWCGEFAGNGADGPLC